MLAAFDARRASAHSRYVTRFVSSPATDGFDPGLLPWLKQFAARDGPHVLLPAHDFQAWWFALHRQDLEGFQLALAPFEAMNRMLNKQLLFEACLESGTATPLTWAPESEQEVAALAGRIPYPAMVKPRTHAGSNSPLKGFRVSSPAGLLPSWKRLLTLSLPFAPEALAVDRFVDRPIVQQFAAGVSQAVYNISGYALEDGSIPVSRGSKKLLQAPRSVGVGVAFDDVSVDEEALAGLERLFRHTGFFGAFEVEFVPLDGKDHLIDMNPRFQRGLIFDVARGMPTPVLSYHHARGDGAAFDGALTAAAATNGQWAGSIALHGQYFDLMCRLQPLFRSMSRDDVRRLRAWRASAPGSVDLALAEDDPAPGIVDRRRNIRHLGTDPRTLLGTYALVR